MFSSVTNLEKPHYKMCLFYLHQFECSFDVMIKNIFDNFLNLEFLFLILEMMLPFNKFATIYSIKFCSVQVVMGLLCSYLFTLSYLCY